MTDESKSPVESPARRLREAARLCFASARAFHGQGLRLRAMGLTYLSLFALVPAMVVAFLVLRVFTGTDWIWARVRELLLENLAVGARASIEPYLDQFVKKAHTTSAGLIGGALLVYSAVSLFSYVERAVNDIWSVRRSRPLRQQLLIYWAGLTLGPLLLAAPATLGHWATSRLGSLAANAGAALLTCGFFTILCLIIPATRVRLWPAALGGIVAGLAWEIARAAYTWVAARFLHYDVIYGSLAFFPIFITWLYVSWTLLLFGARVAFVAQNARALLRSAPPDGTPLARELLAARTMFEVALSFAEGSPTPDLPELAARLQALGAPVREALAVLREGGLVSDLAGGGIAPTRPLQEISLADIRRLVLGSTAEAQGDSAALLTAAIEPADALADRALSEVSYAELCARWRRQREQAGDRQLGSA